MELDRRNFLKKTGEIIAATAAAASLPSEAVAKAAPLEPESNQSVRGELERHTISPEMMSDDLIVKLLHNLLQLIEKRNLPEGADLPEQEALGLLHDFFNANAELRAKHYKHDSVRRTVEMDMQALTFVLVRAAQSQINPQVANFLQKQYLDWSEQLVEASLGNTRSSVGVEIDDNQNGLRVTL